MISVIFIKGKSLKLHASVSIHATSISSPLNRNTDCPQSLLHRVPGKKTTSILTATLSLTSLHFSPFHSCYHESISLRPSTIPSFCISIWDLQNFSFTCSASLPTHKLEGVLLSIQTSFLWLPLLLNSLSKISLSLFGPLYKRLTHSALFHLLESFLVLSVSLLTSLLMQPYVNLSISFKKLTYWLFINSGQLSSLPGLFWTPSLPGTGTGCPYCH